MTEPGAHRLWRPYTQMQTEPPPFEAVETAGARIRLADGRWLIDGIASWWTAVHGYNHPHIVEAMERQLRAMPHVMFGGLTHRPAMTLAERLASVLPGAGTDAALAHVFFCDSGSVAVEIAMKMAVQYWRNQRRRMRRKFVSFRRAYHGDTMGAMALCDPDDGMHALFNGYFPEQILTDIPRTGEDLLEFGGLLDARRDEIAGVIVEPLVQAAGGMAFHSPETLKAIRNACAARDILFIADEIATGFGRTGTMFACDAAGVAPDIICIGKALSGGAISLAATCANDRVFEAFLGDDEGTALMHGPTFMANPLACAAANASLDLFEDGERLARAKSLQAQFDEALAPCRDLPGIADVRALGAIGVVEMDAPRDVSWLRQRFVEERVWVRPFGRVAYLMPPLILDDKEAATLTGAMVAVMTEWAERENA